MKKSTKGAFAAGAAGVLLLGGAGSLAFWSDSDIIGGGTINAGNISITEANPGTCAAAPFIFDAGENGAHNYVPGTSTIVPGDQLTKVCTFTVSAAGDHLRATLAATGGAEGGDLAAETATSAVFTVNGNTQTTLTSADNNATLVATITVDFPYGAATNGSQGDSLTVSDYTIALTQVHNAPVVP
ncbi:MAG: alternate-type signal peptide domain-containing protein [Aeromicrobium sp.]